jgi:hypothetical protein
MADKKISQLTPAALPLAGTEVLPIVQTGSTVKVASNDLTVKNIRSNATTGILQVTGPAIGTTRVMTVPDANFTPLITTDIGVSVQAYDADTAKLDTTQTWTAKQTFQNGADVTGLEVQGYTEDVVSIGTVGASHTIDLTNGTVQTATLTASTATTFTMPTATAGKSFMLFLKQAAATGNGTATFTNVKWNGAGAPTITATAGKMDILAFFADGTNWYGSINQGFTP